MNNEQITVNFENLTTEEREQFMALVRKANKPAPWWKRTEFDIRGGDICHYVTVNGDVSTTNLICKSNDSRVTFGNAYKDRAYMEQRAQEIKLDNLIHNFAHVVNEDWEPDWKRHAQKKYFCSYNYIAYKWEVCCNEVLRTHGAIYFKSEELAQRCIDEIILPFERGEL